MIDDLLSERLGLVTTSTKFFALFFYPALNMHYLRNSVEIRRKLSDLFSGTGKKWAIVGFVGYNALDHLPSQTFDLNVVCWPKAGGTNPDGVRRLLENGICVYFCDRLHQKIYWREHTGLIIGSANLSENALGDGGLHEFGVFCDDENFDITGVLAGLNYVTVTAEALAKLDVEHAKQARKKDSSDETNHNEVPSFLRASEMTLPRQWKLINWTELRDDNSLVRAEVKTHFGTTTWLNDNDAQSNAYREGDFVFQVKTDDDDMIKVANGEWLFVDHVIRKRGNRVLVQINKLDSRTPPPFLIDSAFRKNLKAAFNAQARWSDIYDKQCVIQPKFVRAIRAQYGSQL